MSQDEKQINPRREIRSRYREIMSARRDKQREAMETYDSEVYLPALSQLKAECGGLGHGTRTYHDNGLGWTFIHCASCGGCIEKIGPEKDGEEQCSDT